MTAQRATEQLVEGNGQALALNPSFAPCSGGKAHEPIFCRHVCSTVVGDRLCRTLMIRRAHCALHCSHFTVDKDHAAGE